MSDATPRIDREFPQGDGDPDCSLCRGRGVVLVDLEVRPRFMFEEILNPCKCVLRRDVKLNAKRAWAPLEDAKPVKTSPLKGHEKKNVWITVSGEDLKHHLKRVILDMPPSWFIRVTTDVDLMNTWLSKDIPDEDVLDADVALERQHRTKSHYNSLTALVESPALLVIKLMKTSRNAAMPEVLQEALLTRDHMSKPTWLVDQPDHRLAKGHLSWSEAVIETLRPYARIELDAVGGTSSRVSAGTCTVAPLPAISDLASGGTGMTGRSLLDEFSDMQDEVEKRDRFKPKKGKRPQ